MSNYQSDCYKIYHKALKDGLLVRQACEVCGDVDSHGHHEDYNKPLEVKWLCREHHIQEHKRLGWGFNQAGTRSVGRPKKGSGSVRLVAVYLEPDDYTTIQYYIEKRNIRSISELGRMLFVQFLGKQDGISGQVKIRADAYETNLNQPIPRITIPFKSEWTNTPCPYCRLPQYTTEDGRVCQNGHFYALQELVTGVGQIMPAAGK